MSDKEILLTQYKPQYQALKKQLERSETTRDNTRDQLATVQKYAEDAQNNYEADLLEYNKLMEQIDAEGITTEDLA